ncbi:MAG TPA: SDR family oxidoreductase [Acetobacteraceae bacterium]|nr:SDR family oxidoreductase [Acetobacteraceae bacterium]
MRLGLQGKVALVTGGGRDVGGAIASALAEEGALVAVNYRRSAKEAEAVVAAIAAAGGRARAFQADMADWDAVRAMVDAVVAAYGRIDILVNNAGVALRQRFQETTPADWKAHIDVGLYGPIHCCHAVLPHMIRQQHGRIISLAGDSSRIGESGLALAAAARAGAIALMKSLAKEFGRFGITANAVALGLVETAHSDPAWLAENRERIIRLYPLRRIGRPDDVAPMIAFLASDAAGWITGQVLSINGGFSMA